MAKGGKRPGAGRKPGKMNDARIELALKARKQADKAIGALVKNLEDENGSVRNTAADMLLNRGFGKAPQEVIIEDGQTDTAVEKPRGLSELLGMAQRIIGEGTEDTDTPPGED